MSTVKSTPSIQLLAIFVFIVVSLLEKLSPSVCLKGSASILAEFNNQEVFRIKCHILEKHLFF